MKIYFFIIQENQNKVWKSGNSFVSLDICYTACPY